MLSSPRTRKISPVPFFLLEKCRVLDLDTMARTIYSEARGESRIGQVAVAWVIVNRALEGYNFLKQGLEKQAEAYRKDTLKDMKDLKVEISQIDKADIERKVQEKMETAPFKPHPLFGDGTIYSACLRPAQFSCWNVNDPNLQKIKDLPVLSKDYLLCHEVCVSVLLGVNPDPTQGSTHYHAKSVRPFWVEGAHYTGTIGGHLFYKDVP